MNIAVKQPQQAQAWRIEFTDRARPDEAPLILEPRSVWVTACEQSVTRALRDITPGETSDSIVFIFLPAGGGTPRAFQKQAETWMGSRSGERGPMLEVHTTSGRVLWRRGRAVCFGMPHDLKEPMTGIIRFSFCERELSSLERQVQKCWLELEADILAMKQMSASNIMRQPHIEQMTKLAATMRMEYVRLMTALEAPKSDLPGSDRRLFLELALQANAIDRLRMLDDAIEVYEEFYKHEREQFAEFRYFMLEYRLVLLILLALIVQLLLPDQSITTALISLFHWAYANAVHLLSSLAELVRKVWLGHDFLARN